MLRFGLPAVLPFHSSFAKIALLIATAAGGIAVLEVPWLASSRRVRGCTYVLVGIGILLLLYIAAYGLGDPMASSLLLGALVVTAALLAASRQWLVDAALHKERASHLATLGRFTAQMSHDVKNPLMALKGAAQVLRDDVEAGRPLVPLMLEQIERIGRVVDTYGRLARIDLIRTRVDVNALVREVVKLQTLGPSAAVTVRAELTEGLPECSADADMLASILENLVRNALEAMPAGGGRVVVRTQAPALGDPAGVEIVVEDDGIGMDSRTRARAFDDFFTTKPTGSGLGLAFVKRVVAAHGGEVTLASELGRGTVVRVLLPTA